MRFIIAGTVLVPIILLMPLPAAAESHEGVVRQIRIDSESDAPLCVATIPNMPGGTWACIYPNRRHYLEMKEMLFRALDSKHTCTAQIMSVTCSAREHRSTRTLSSIESADARMPIKEDPATPAFWDVRFRQKRTPWDAGSAPPDLESYLIQNPDGGQVLIPGCGSAYEVRSFLEKGYDVVAIDFSEAAVERATAELGPLHTTVVLGDFFTHNVGPGLFDVIYERAFLASLPRKMWGDYAARVVELLRSGGRLIGFFVYGEQQGGPPFCLKSGELALLLGEKFEKVEDVAAISSVPVFEGKEHWEVWIRKN